MTAQQELEVIIDKMVEEFDKLKKENLQLWNQLEKTEKENEESVSRIRELELRLETESQSIETLIRRVKTSLGDETTEPAQ